MIFAYRLSKLGNLHLAHFFTSRHMSLPIFQSAETCFRAFDEAFIKIKNDRDSTKIYSEDDVSDQKLMELNTATQAALRTVLRNRRNVAQLFTVACDQRPGSKQLEQRRIWSNLPLWAHYYVQSHDGDILHLVPRPKGEQGQWLRWDVQPDEHVLYISLFQKSLTLNTLCLPDSGATRLGPQLHYGNPLSAVPLRLSLEG